MSATLSNMLPVLAGYDEAYAASINVEALADHLHAFEATRIVNSYLTDGFLRKLGHAVLFSAMIDVAPLGLAILHVLIMRAKKQMVGVYAPRHITVMAHAGSPRVNAESDEVCYPVSRERSALPMPKDSISALVKIPAPKPALLWVVSSRILAKANDIGIFQVGYWLRLLAGHWISFQDQCSRPRSESTPGEAFSIVSGVVCPQL